MYSQFMGNNNTTRKDNLQKLINELSTSTGWRENVMECFDGPFSLPKLFERSSHHKLAALYEKQFVYSSMSHSLVRAVRMELPVK